MVSSIMLSHTWYFEGEFMYVSTSVLTLDADLIAFEEWKHILSRTKDIPEHVHTCLLARVYTMSEIVNYMLPIKVIFGLGLWDLMPKAAQAWLKMPWCIG
jgi:hypothetical protein